ncbi:pilus assembly protein [Rahnella aceris]|nr:pilus assembly protein [Rahnella aceris]
MLNTLSRNNILTGLIWDSSNHENMDAGYMRWMVNIRRSHRMYVYRVQDDMTTNELVGYSIKTAPGCESFAVHLRKLYGDGLYHFMAGDEQVYLLIIMDGIIISGSDCVITETFFGEILSSLPESKYSRLRVSEITPAQLDCIAESCKENQLIYKKKQRIFWTGVAGGVALLVICSSIFLYSIISG